MNLAINLMDLFLKLLQSFTNPLFYIPLLFLLLGLMVRYFFVFVGGMN